MSKLTKNQKLVADKVEAGKAYTLKEATELVKEITTTKEERSPHRMEQKTLNNPIGLHAKLTSSAVTSSRTMI